MSQKGDELLRTKRELLWRFYEMEQRGIKIQHFTMEDDVADMMFAYHKIQNELKKEQEKQAEKEHVRMLSAILHTGADVLVGMVAKGKLKFPPTEPPTPTKAPASAPASAPIPSAPIASEAIASEATLTQGSNECPICQDESRQRDTVLNCRHFYCSACAASVSTCPLCRTPITSRVQVYL